MYLFPLYLEIISLTQHLDGLSVDLTLGIVTTQAKPTSQKRPQKDRTPSLWENGLINVNE